MCLEGSLLLLCSDSVPWALRGHVAEHSASDRDQKKKNGDHIEMLCALGLGMVYLISTYNPQASTHLHTDT